MSPQSNFFEFPEPEDLIIRRNELREELPHWLFVVVDWLLTTKGPGPGKPHLMTPWWVTAWVGDVQAFMIFTPFLVIATMMFHHISHNPNDEEVQEYMKQKTLHLIGLAVLNIPSNILFRWFFARYSLKLLPIDPAGEHNSITIEDLGTGEVREVCSRPICQTRKGCHTVEYFRLHRAWGTYTATSEEQWILSGKLDHKQRSLIGLLLMYGCFVFILCDMGLGLYQKNVSDSQPKDSFPTLATKIGCLLIMLLTVLFGMGVLLRTIIRHWKEFGTTLPTYETSTTNGRAHVQQKKEN